MKFCLAFLLLAASSAGANNDHERGLSNNMRGNSDQNKGEVKKAFQDILQGYPFRNLPAVNEDVEVTTTTEQEQPQEQVEEEQTTTTMQQKLQQKLQAQVQQPQEEEPATTTMAQKLQQELQDQVQQPQEQEEEDEEPPTNTMAQKLQQKLQEASSSNTAVVAEETNVDGAPAPAVANTHDDVKHALHMYYNSLQVVLGYKDPPSNPEHQEEIMAPFIKEVEWSLNQMHPGFDQNLVNDHVVMHQLHKTKQYQSSKGKQQPDGEERRTTDNAAVVDSAQCLQATQDVLSISLRLAYYGLYGDLHGIDDSETYIQTSGQDLANQLDVAKARDALRMLGPLQKENPEELKLVAREVFKIAEQQVGLDGILQQGIQHWDVANFWATGKFASVLWANALQISVFDTFTLPAESSTEIHTSFDQDEFSSVVEAYNIHCATCPMGWTNHGVSNHGLHCTTGYSPTCDNNCLKEECRAVKGKWLDVDLEFNPYTCYMSVCPTGWTNLGYDIKEANGAMMCTMARSGACDESCAQTQCQNVGGMFPLELDDVADNPYVCFA